MVTVVAPEIGATVADLAARGLLIMRRRPPAPDDFNGAALVVPATGVAERDQMIAAAARDHGVRLCLRHQPRLSSLQAPDR